MRTFLFASLIGGVCLGSAAAQTSFPAAITDTSGSATTRFEQDALETSAFASFVPRADFSGSAAGSCDEDLLFTHACFWRVASEARLRQFYDNGNAGDQGSISHTVSGDQWTVRWPNAANRNQVDATWTAQVVAFGDGGGQVRHTWSLVNTTGAPLQLEFYAYADVDVAVNFFNETTPNATSDRHIVRLPGSVAVLCPSFAEFRGVAPNSWQVAQWPTIENALTGAAFGGLTSAGLPLGGPNGADYSGAFGWTASVAPGASLDVVYYLGHNVVQCDAVASVQHYGAAHGATSLSTSDVPVLGRTMSLAAIGPPNATAGVLVGAQTNVSLVGCPQTILVDPIGTLALTLDAGGGGTLELPASAAPAFCGMSFFCQLVALSAAEPCFPFQHSDGMQLTFGN